jgi:hypothetical protein
LVQAECVRLCLSAASPAGEVAPEVRVRFLDLTLLAPTQKALTTGALQWLCGAVSSEEFPAGQATVSPAAAGEPTSLRLQVKTLTGEKLAVSLRAETPEAVLAVRDLAAQVAQQTGVLLHRV